MLKRQLSGCSLAPFDTSEGAATHEKVCCTCVACDFEPQLAGRHPPEEHTPDTRCMRQVGSMSSTSISRCRRAGSTPGMLLSIWEAGMSPCTAEGGHGMAGPVWGWRAMSPLAR